MQLALPQIQLRIEKGSQEEGYHKFREEEQVD